MNIFLYQDELCQVLIPLAEARNELDTLLVNIFTREVRKY